MSKAPKTNEIKWIQSETGGVEPMSIQGRMFLERERTIGMTDGERAWRAQFLRDQQLDPSEPIVPKGFEKERYNIFRRIYRYPLNQVEKMITPLVGKNVAYMFRATVGKYFLGSLIVFYMAYNARFMHKENWQRQRGIRASISRPVMYPNDPNYPNWKHRTSDFAVNGFDKSPI